jgi:plasmid stabilization system protein ParE
MPTKFRVRIALTAERDIEAIWAFIANDNFEAAGRFIYQFNEATSRAGIGPRP